MNGIFVMIAIFVTGAVACWWCERQFSLLPEKGENRQASHILNEATRGHMTTIRAQYAEIGYFPERRWRV